MAPIAVRALEHLLRRNLGGYSGRRMEDAPPWAKFADAAISDLSSGAPARTRPRRNLPKGIAPALAMPHAIAPLTACEMLGEIGREHRRVLERVCVFETIDLTMVERQRRLRVFQLPCIKTRREVR